MGIEGMGLDTDDERGIFGREILRDLHFLNGLLSKRTSDSRWAVVIFLFFYVVALTKLRALKDTSILIKHMKSCSNTFLSHNPIRNPLLYSIRLSTST